MRRQQLTMPLHRLEIRAQRQDPIEPSAASPAAFEALPSPAISPESVVSPTPVVSPAPAASASVADYPPSSAGPQTAAIPAIPQLSAQEQAARERWANAVVCVYCGVVLLDFC